MLIQVETLALMTGIGILGISFCWLEVRYRRIQGKENRGNAYDLGKIYVWKSNNIFAAVCSGTGIQVSWIFKRLLYYPTCRAQLRVSTWSVHDLPQMTYLEVGGRDDVISQPTVFGYLTILIDEIGQLNNIQLYHLKNPILSVRIVK